MSASLNRLPPDRTTAARLMTWAHARSVATLALIALAFVAERAPAAQPPVHAPQEVRSAPAQFIVVAVSNPVTGRPSAVGGTAHGYGADSNYRVSASVTSQIRELSRQYSLTLVSEWPI